MSVLEVDRITVEPPPLLPVTHLSVSSMNLYLRCPQAWKRRHVDKVRERPNGRMTLGKSAGAALTQHFGCQLETGEGLSTEQLLDEYSADFDSREDTDYGTDVPGQLKDSGAAALALYHRIIAPKIKPVSVEREFELSWPDVPWVLTGFLDLETADGAVADFKMIAQRWSADKAKAALQPTGYLAARRAEGNPATRFEYHTCVRTKQPTAEIVPTTRSERRLDLFTDRVFSIARSIEWRWLHDCWQGAPEDLAWLCRSCGYAPDCAWSLA
jgi:hypothetical protein